ncbi:hypothetical protein [Thermococcus paralvinellae]|uniref:Uncharacterized protein n=1 Tax=Thermococcus paralvinellae TaxID=582419 RepID=W0I8X6_9EURY|nr:hypothetical protein [Thermococcus paralvinellae]AHF80888.1 Hypothetical protein TES1_1510 [Thermococcus paralvinellae]
MELRSEFVLLLLLLALLLFSALSTNTPEQRKRDVNITIANLTIIKAPLPKYCSYTIEAKGLFWENSLNNVSFKIFANGTLVKSIIMNGINGEYLCKDNRILLYTYYPSDALGVSRYMLLENMSVKWEKEFPSFTLPKFYINGTLILIKHGDMEKNVEPCLIWLDFESGKVGRKFCHEFPSDILDVKLTNKGVYLTTSDGFLIWIHKEGVKQTFVDRIDGIILGARMRIIIENNLIHVSYSFANERGESKRGECIFTSKLIKIRCEKS